ncbi:hypothetical protein Tco_1300972 [Tanacetum coccineum]
MESLNSNSQERERAASVATNARQSKGKLHGIFSTTSFISLESGKQDTSSSLGNYPTHVVDADIRPVNDQVPFDEVQLTAQHNVLANEQQPTEQSEPIYDTYLLEKIDSNTTPDSTNIILLTQVQEFKEFKSDEHASYDVWTKQFKPRSSSNDVWTKQFKPRLALQRWMTFGQNSSSLVLYQMTFVHTSSGLALQRWMSFGQNSSSLAPLLKEKKGVRFSALYLSKKRNLLIYEQSYQQLLKVLMLVQSGTRSYPVDAWTISSELSTNPAPAIPYSPPTNKELRCYSNPSDSRPFVNVFAPDYTLKLHHLGKSTYLNPANPLNIMKHVGNMYGLLSLDNIIGILQVPVSIGNSLLRMHCGASTNSSISKS